jgi:DNA mismatch repair protein MutS2
MSNNENSINYNSSCKYFDNRTLDFLGFPTIKRAIVDRTHTETGRYLAGSLIPKGEIEEALKGLNTSMSAKNFINEQGALTVYLPDDIAPNIAISQKEGAFLSEKEIADVRSLITESIKVKSKLSSHETEYPRLWEIAKEISEPRELLKYINSILDERGEIKDNATKRLGEIRENIKNTRDKIYKKLEGYLTKRVYADYITEQAVVIRNERFCIPVRPEDAGKIGGIVHSRSSSGETSFLEPYSVVDDNNNLATLRSDEEKEVRKILEETTRKIGEERSALEANIDALSKIDFYLAIGKFALSMPTILPEIRKNAPLVLIKAYNPQLAVMAIDEKKKVEETVVPVDVFLDREKRVAIISGPNAGGKTVSLKTVGLIVAMAYSGIPVPAGEGTTIPDIDNILCDIGEEESIEEALSSFTSHILRLKTIMERATVKSLILLDELGRSTSPDYGSAIGIAVIEHILNIGSYCIATTHYEGIKALGATNQNVINAAVEFSPEDARPTYRLIWGSYGTSHALETAFNLGLEENIITRAREYLGEDRMKLDEIVNEYERQVSQLETMKRELEEEKKKFIDERANLYDEKEKTKNERKELKKERARLTRGAIDEIRKELRNLLKEAKKGGEKEIVKALEKVSSIEKQLVENEKEENVEFGLDIDSWVRLKGSDAITQVVKIDRERGRATVTLKGRKIDIALSELVPADDIDEEHRDRRAGYELTREVSPEIMVRGMTIDEAIAVLDGHIQRAFLSGLGVVTIIHGLGTGRLRDGIRAFLRTHPLVLSHRAGGEGEGGDGVTVAILAEKERK